MSVPETDPLAPLRAMIELLPQAALEEVGHALHARLNAPPTAAQRRVKELAFLNKVLEGEPQRPGRLPYVKRTKYDERQPIDAPDAPPSARLTERYGSWTRACHAAWGLLKDGRSVGDGQPWPRPTKHAKPYTVEEAKASVRRCAKALGHQPSSYAYHMWVIARRARARASGKNVPAVHVSAVYRLLAPDRKDLNGWSLVTARVFGDLADAPIPSLRKALAAAEQRRDGDVG